ncbi:flagellar basal body P-ring protein FlgI [Caminibacter pacificus]|uniref:Flagellar P-ring protein n=1 Tax=Caminibacter pacificus TaxID=1424653 RepID=A0AAJ4RCE4_9BACT|nr:flagellar basal body P-ring protein FlgI [Caminibacter pacificus]QCI28912.1 flagellar basal body P-ring protein FlgI [Caminibacter pacificus]ROR39503.1 flagellar P-ring protein precursor FlgI [Caminibacter pacificus]
MNIFKSVLILSLLFSFAFSQKIKEISSIVGVRSNQLFGYGVVGGLDGTGDSSTKFTKQFLSNFLKNTNLKIDPQDIKSKNVAAVIVTATLPPFAREGDKIDVTVSSIGDAKSLQGGVLLITPLIGVDGKIYALAQGPITMGGFNTKGGKKQKHFTTTVKVIKGATVERAVVWDIYHKKFATLSLNTSDFNLAINVQKTINSFFKQNVAIAIDPRTVKLKKPKNLSMPEFLAMVENLNVKVPHEPVIVIDERTGTVIAGSDIKVQPTVIVYGNFTIKIDKETSVLELTSNLQRVKATPQDVIAILENLRASRAISAKIVVN